MIQALCSICNNNKVRFWLWKRGRQKLPVHCRYWWVLELMHPFPMFPTRWVCREALEA